MDTAANAQAGTPARTGPLALTIIGLPGALIFGILVSTLLTLVVIPVLYYALYRQRQEARGGADAA